VARRRGPLLLLAFLVAVMASGGGGVTAPWIPRPVDVPSDERAVVQADNVVTTTIWKRLRME